MYVKLYAVIVIFFLSSCIGNNIAKLSEENQDSNVTNDTSETNDEDQIFESHVSSSEQELLELINVETHNRTINPDQTTWAITQQSPLYDAPTMQSVGIRWNITGDQNQNSSIHVLFRKSDESLWRLGMDLFRVESEAMEELAPPSGTTLYAGSIFNLAADTNYEVKLILDDPDMELAQEVFTVRTYKEPMPTNAIREIHAIPGNGGGSGTLIDPFRGLNEINSNARAGDHILLHEGTYTGGVNLSANGTPDELIVWRPYLNEDVIIDGGSTYAFAMYTKSYHYFENITFKSSSVAVRLPRSRFITFKRCSFENVRGAIFDDGGAHRIYFSDNTLTGIQQWKGESISGEVRAIELSGIGHIVSHNDISNFKDCVNLRSPWPLRDIDIHNNNIHECSDDGIELDFSQHNVRAFKNRITNSQMGISFQPSKGGPNYAIKNILYNIGHESFKLHLTPTNRTAPDWKIGPHRTSGGVLLHNTIVKYNVPFRVWSDEGPIHYFYARNNLFVGNDTSIAIEITAPMRYSNFDYNVYATSSQSRFASWNETNYNTIADFRNSTNQEQHGSFTTNINSLFSSSYTIPSNKDTLYSNSLNYPEPQSNLLIDKGEIIYSINDNFDGLAPDIGAIERNQISSFGPRN